MLDRKYSDYSPEKEEKKPNKPKYTYGDIVKFKFNDNDIKEGVIAIVDAYGTFERPGIVSYDILVKSENILYKHFIEPWVIEKTGRIDEKDIW